MWKIGQQVTDLLHFLADVRGLPAHERLYGAAIAGSNVCANNLNPRPIRGRPSALIAAASEAKRVLPIPASPAMATIRVLPARTSATILRREAVSLLRPTKGELDGVMS